METTMIRLQGVGKRYGKTDVLRDVDMEVESGSIFALLGPNGAGKTTIINILTTLERPDTGSAWVDGFDVVRDPVQVQRRLSVTGQSAAVDGRLTGEENLVMMSRLSGLDRTTSRAKSRELLARFDLEEAARRTVAKYSGGMRRRLDLALSLIVRTRVLFLDEPTTGLDTRSRQSLWAAIRQLRDEGTTVFLTTQYLEEADELADRIAVLDKGHVVAVGTASALKSQVGGEVVTLADADGEILREFPTDGSVAGIRRALQELEAADLQGTIGIRSPSMDDVFLALTSGTNPEQAAARRALR